MVITLQTIRTEAWKIVYYLLHSCKFDTALFDDCRFDGIGLTVTNIKSSWPGNLIANSPLPMLIVPYPIVQRLKDKFGGRTKCEIIFNMKMSHNNQQSLKILIDELEYVLTTSGLATLRAAGLYEIEPIEGDYDRIELGKNKTIHTAGYPIKMAFRGSI